MTAYRKKPVVIEAWKIDYESEQPEWVKVGFKSEALDWSPDGEGGLWINTLEGCMVGNVGDMLIRGVKGELYACKPDIFEATYELAEPRPSSSGQAVEARGLPPLPEPACLILAEDVGHRAFTQDQMQAYARAALAAQADARREDTAMLDAAQTEAYAEGRSDERDECCGAMGDVVLQHEAELDRVYACMNELEVDAARWRKLPAFLEEFQIEYVVLIRAIDSELASDRAAMNTTKGADHAE